MHSEKKIDSIEERLGSIEKTLQELAKSVSASRPSSHFTPLPRDPSQPQVPLRREPTESKGPFYATNPTIEQHDSSSAFEGSSSLSAHGAYASAVLESAVSNSSPQVLSSPKINAALLSLKQIVGLQSQRRENDLQGAQLPSKKPRRGLKCDIRDLEMPPLQLVLRVLRQVKGSILR